MEINLGPLKEMLTKRLKDYLGVEDIVLQEDTNFFKREKLEKNLMCEIMILNLHLGLNLKVFFNLKDIVELNSNLGSNNKEEFIKDYVRELINYTGGGIKNALGENGSSTLISIPYLTAAFYDIFIKKESALYHYKYAWRMYKGDSFSSIITVEFSCNDLKDLEIIQKLDNKNSSDDLELF